MPTSQQIQQALEQVHDQASFVESLLRNTLNWPIPPEIDNPEDMSYLWSDEDLGANDLVRDIVAGQIFQIQPMRDDQPWGIFLVEFQNEEAMIAARGLTGPLRKILRGLVPRRRNRPAELQSWERENLLFICTYNYQYFRCAYFKSPMQRGHAEPLATFGWEDGNVPRTTCEFNLNHLLWPPDQVSPDQWISEWAKAFDVERVTNKFYEDYKRVFEDLQLVLNLPTADDKKMFAQVLMNRLMFLRFVERKNWLKFGNSDPKEYLKNLYLAGPLNNLSWYRSRLQVLFFEGLAIPNHDREDIIGSVPYLNGGLFTVSEWDERAGDIPDEVFEPILSANGLLYRYNFTVEESTPLDIEVAVDPEMLGKVFEKLVTARCERGSYYTPRTVVSFMCREALKGYLGSQYAPLIDERKTDDITVAQARDLLARLDTVKIVDPACGSGAYLLGMLQELFALSEILDTRAQTHDPHTAYQRKLQIISNNIYGVDLDDFAVGIARLRLWLSLAVDFTGEHPDPLPNLDFKIEDGDSLTAPDPSAGGQLDFFRQERIRQFDALKAAYMNPVTRAQQPNLWQQIQDLRAEIASFSHPRQRVHGFDWRVEFAEVWSQNNGFDIVIANPPYGISVDDSVRNQYFNQQSENERGQSKDSYGIFMARGLQLLRPGGVMSYIVSDTWRTIKSHRPLRKRLLDCTTVFHIIDLPSWIFDATVNTGVLTVQKQVSPPEHELIAADLRGIEDGNWKMLSDNMIAISGHGPDIQTLACARYTYLQSGLLKYSNYSFFIASPRLFSMMYDASMTRFGDVGVAVHGISTGANRKYVRVEPGTRGNLPEIEDWMKMPAEEMAALSEDEKVRGVDKDWEALTGCFVPFEKGGASDAGEGWLPNYYMPTEFYVNWATGAIEDMKENPGVAWKNKSYFFKEGLTFSISGIYAPTFRLNSGGVFEAKGSGIFCDEIDREVLLGYFCSMLARYQFKCYIKHSVDTSGDNINEFRFPMPNEETSNAIRELVNRIIQNQRDNQRYPYWLNEQKDIDNLIFRLYGVNSADIREIELWYCRRYHTLAQAQGLIGEVTEKYADHLARCERILSMPPSYWRSNPILQLIAQGENHTLEFKETLEWDVRQNQHTPHLNKECLKTIAAFLNTDGGTLLIGVADNGEIKGLARDLQHVRRNNLDGFELKLRNLLRDRLNPTPTGNVDIRFEELAEGTVCKVDVRPVPRDQVIHFDSEVYIRDGNSSRKLEGPDLTHWVQHRNTR